MLSLLVLFVLILIISQISYSTKTDERVTRNEETLTSMDLAIESILLQVYDDLTSDAESSPAGAAAAMAGGETSQDAAAPSDSREDAWARPQRTELNSLQVRVLIQDEDSKFNLLSVLTANEEEAEKAFERLVRVIEFSRKGTKAEIDGGDARRIATAIQDFMKRRRDQVLPKPEQLSDDDEEPDRGLPLSLNDFHAVDPELFPADLLRDFRDEEENVVHSLASFLTIYSSLAAESEPEQEGPSSETTPAAEGDDQQNQEQEPGGDETDPQAESDSTPQAEQGAGPGGTEQGQADSAAADGRINLNTAPAAVLKALLDDRDVPYRFWDEVLQYRNDPAEEEGEPIDEEDLPLDEYGEPMVPKKFFASFDDLSQLDNWVEIDPLHRGELRNLLKTSSSVFSIYVTARKPTGEERITEHSRREDIEREEAEGPGLVRTVRSIVWRKESGGSIEIVPLVRWEVLDHVPYEVLDLPDEDR